MKNILTSVDKMDNEYDASKIVVLEGPAGIRKRPAMYIGSTGSSGVLHLLYEIIDNSVDEYLAGYANRIKVSLYSSESGDIASVEDNGRGIPVDIMPQYGKTALEVIMTTLHKGAKFNNDVYKVSGGLHGVGLTVVNALSEYTIVTVKRNGKIYTQKFSKGNVESKLEVIGNSEESGTTITFKPDPEIFKNPKFDSELLKERLRYTSFLNRKLRIDFVDERFEQKEEEMFYSEKGIEEFVDYLSKGNNKICKTIYGKAEKDTIKAEVAITYVDSYDERVEGFVNSIRTLEGGSHIIGFRSGLSRAIINYISKNYKEDVKVTGEDAREGLVAVISILMQNPEFEGQTKEKLGNSEIKSFVESFLYSLVSRFLEENPNEAAKIVEKIINAANAREAARKAKELARKKRLFDNSILQGKLTDCIESDPDKTELFIVEGESAGGSSKQGRDKRIQAILPLRGKILNVEKAGYEKIFNSKEISSLITAIGAGINETFNPDNVRYKKIIIMTDADVDGSHIRTLLLTFFYRFMRKLIELGYVYIAQPPLYKISKGKEVYYCYSDSELEEMTKRLGKFEVQRYKGLGEMNAEQLWETTMNPETRVIKQVTIRDAQIANEMFEILMGMDVAKRRKFLEEHSGEVMFLDV
ncbi:MAG: DNA gyrase subunit B [Candidatus Micrarchaeaceae archaeon]